MYVATVVVMLGFAPSTAQAGPLENIWNIVAQADNANQIILNQFAAAAISASTVEELNAARATADAQLDGVWYSSNGALNAIADNHPEYEDDVAEARSVLTTDHNDAHAEVSTIYNAVLDAMTGGTTTTTTPPTTTTTSIPGTSSTSTTSTSSTTTTSTTSTTSTTTTTRPSTTTTTRPPSATTTTTTDPATTTTTTAPTTTTTAPSIAVPPPPPGNPPSTSETPPVVDDPNQVLTAPPGLDAETGEGEGATGDQPAASGTRRGIVSEMITTGVSQVFPPALAQFTAAPFVVVELLVMTLIDSIWTMILPFVAISLVMAAFLWSENRRERELQLS